MAIYHCSIKVISRGKGKSAVAAAAYRAGEKITNEFDGMTAQNAPTAPAQGAETAAQANTPPAARTAHTAREDGAGGSMDGGGLQG